MSNAPPAPAFRKDGACEQIYQYVAAFYSKAGFAPSYRQIADDLGFVSKSSVHHHLMHLSSDGFILIHGSRGAIPKGEV